jgi:KTSC domain-containing protein
MKFQPVKSSNLAEAAYDAENKVAQVRFKSGGLYEYPNIEPKDWNEFEKTFQAQDSSHGAFARYIKNDKFKKIKEKE